MNALILGKQMERGQAQGASLLKHRAETVAATFSVG